MSFLIFGGLLRWTGRPCRRVARGIRYITLFNLSNTPISLNGHIFGPYCNYRGVLTKLIAIKVGAGIMYD